MIFPGLLPRDLRDPLRNVSLLKRPGGWHSTFPNYGAFMPLLGVPDGTRDLYPRYPYNQGIRAKTNRQVEMWPAWIKVGWFDK